MQDPAFLSLGGTLTLETKPTFLICTSVFPANKNPSFALASLAVSQPVWPPPPPAVLATPKDLKWVRAA